MKTQPSQAAADASSLSFQSWIQGRVDAESYWFHQIEVLPGYFTPGWSNPQVEKLPYYGVPEYLSGMRVLDIGCAEGFFSFEAERRGAREVVAIDSSPDSVRRFEICRAALGFRTTPYLCSVYDLSRRSFGTFDLVMFYGVLYHLRHPLLALEKIHDLCSGSLLMQTATWEDPAHHDEPLVRFHPLGIDSGPGESGKPIFDPTVFWVPNRAAVLAMLEHVGMQEVHVVSDEPTVSIVAGARSAHPGTGTRPDPVTAP